MLSSATAKDDAADFEFTPRPYQLVGESFLSGSSAALLADEMGLGKSLQVIIAIRSLYKSDPAFTRALIVAPAALLTNWKREFNKFAPRLGVQVVRGHRDDRRFQYQLPIPITIVGYETIRSDAADLPQQYPYDVVVLDEAQRIKDSGSLLALGCRMIPRLRSWALTGTPLENRVSDLASIYQFLAPGLVGAWMGPAELKATIAATFLRRRAEDVAAELPDVLYERVEIDLAPLQRSAYDSAASNGYDVALTSSSNASILAALTRLKQLCNYDEHSNESGKLDVLKSILAEASERGEKTLVFSQFVETLCWLSARLEREPLIYHGAMSHSERDSLIDQFKTASGPEILLVSLKAGSVGLNLQEADNVILFDRWWNPAAHAQAIGRARRIGRAAPVRVYEFEAVNTVEQRIREILEEKQYLFELYINGSIAPDNVSPLRELLIAAAQSAAGGE